MMTVQQLFDYLAHEMKEGHGDYTIFVTNDEEANGYHALYYSGATVDQIVKDQGRKTYNEYYRDVTPELNFDDKKKATKKAIFIG